MLKVAGMTVFEAINHSLTTMATGGFSTRNLSIIGFNSPAIEWIITLFMFIAGINLTLHFNFVRTRKLSYLKNPEFKIYLFIALGAWGLFLLNIQTSLGGELLTNIRLAGFQSISILTTTGYASANFELWPYFSQFLILFLMFFGGMAGSTAGSMKIGRIMIIGKFLKKELTKILHPRMIYKVKIGDQSVPDALLRNISVFVFLYIIIFAVSSLILTLFNIDITTSISATASCLGNVGPGLGEVGALDNYAHLPNIVKYFLSLLMMTGRLELYTVLVILSPRFWRD